MTARSESIQIDIDDEQMSGTFLSPKSKVPGVLFVHGWGGSQSATWNGRKASPAWVVCA
jgi:dienelactone hydrolase